MKTILIAMLIAGMASVLAIFVYRMRKAVRFLEQQIPLLLGKDWIRGHDFLRKINERGLRISRLSLISHMQFLAQEGKVEIRAVEQEINIRERDAELYDYIPGSKAAIGLDSRGARGTLKVNVLWFRIPQPKTDALAAES